MEKYLKETLGNSLAGSVLGRGETERPISRLVEERIYFWNGGQGCGGQEDRLDMSDKKVNLTKKFDDLVDKDIDGQLELYYLKDQTEKKDLNHVQASDFLQQNGKTRTGLERKKECKDIDLNSDGRICFIEYLLLHYKAMILKAYYKRKEIPIVEDLSRDGIGVV
eukprot:1320820-Amorphochlora_amoeboformis.AAC.1